MTIKLKIRYSGVANALDLEMLSPFQLDQRTGSLKKASAREGLRYSARCSVENCNNRLGPYSLTCSIQRIRVITGKRSAKYVHA